MMYISLTRDANKLTMPFELPILNTYSFQRFNEDFF